MNGPRMQIPWHFQPMQVLYQAQECGKHRRVIAILVPGEVVVQGDLPLQCHFSDNRKETCLHNTKDVRIIKIYTSLDR